MAGGIIFIRDRGKITKGEKTPRFVVVGTAGTDLKIFTKHIRKMEIEAIAQKIGAELVMLDAGQDDEELENEEWKGRKLMPLIRDKESQRLHIQSKLMGESLISREFIQNLDNKVDQFRSFPEVTVLKIGGQSITDTGAQGVLPVIREIAANHSRHRMIISTGGGTRSRHVYAIAMELGMPTGIISKLGQSVSEQNALMLSTLLSPYGGVKVGHDDIPKLGGYFAQGCIPVIHGMPPYGYWEQLPKEGSIPPNRTDVGAYLLAEVIGAKQCIFVKDEDGLFTDNPKKNPAAEFIPRIGAGELIDLSLDDLIVERAVLELLLCARSVTQIQIVNGMKPGKMTQALNGEHVGTIIYKDR